MDAPDERPDDLPAGFTTEPVAPLDAPQRDFPRKAIGPNEFLDAEEDPLDHAQRVRASERAPALAQPPEPETDTEPAPSGEGDDPGRYGPRTAAALDPRLRPKATRDPFAAASVQAEERAGHSLSQGALVDSTLAPDMGRIPGVEKGERYWVGTLPGAPVQNIDLFGISFPLFSETVAVVAGETSRIRQNGSVLDLTPSQVEGIKEALKRKIVRWRDAKRRRGFLVTIPTPADAEKMAARGRLSTFTARKDDEPVGMHVYMVRGGRTSDSDFPPSIVPRR